MPEAGVGLTRAMAKRVFDFTVSLSALVVLCPLLAVLSVLIRLEGRGPVFFRQERVGRRGRLFSIIKFRTMQHAPAEPGRLITVGRDHRVTRMGHFLRASKIDELPQLINVVRGEMSLVGPRPEVPKYMAQYPAMQRDVILSVRPGITDFAAIEFSDESSILELADDPERAYVEEIMPRKFALYRRYVEQRSFCLDLWLIQQTLFKIVRQLGSRRDA